MISITAPTFDDQGVLRIDELPGSNLGAVSRRVARVQTLDGGAVINDSGHSPADRTFEIQWRHGRDDYDKARRMVQRYSRVRVVTDEGIFLGDPQQLAPADGTATLTILILEQET